MRGKRWYIKKPEQNHVIRFENNGKDFSALYQARSWLHENGYRYGSLDVTVNNYVAAIKGEEYDLPMKLHNFNQDDINRIDAVMFSYDYREDWVEVWIFNE